MKYRLIAADIDGTLLTSSRELTPETENAIARAKEAGVLFTLSTGRPIMGIRNYKSLLSPDIPLITYNGAMVLRSESEEVISSRCLTPGSARDIYRRGIAKGTTVVAWVHNRLYCNRIDDKVLSYRTITMETPHVIEDFDELCDQVTKMIWIDKPIMHKMYMKELKGQLPEVNYSTSAPILLEFVDRHISKASALADVARELSVPMEEVIAIGDGLNDLDMIRAAGMGVCMANGHPQTKKAADWITRSNDENGLAYMIEQLILNG